MAGASAAAQVTAPRTLREPPTPTTTPVRLITAAADLRTVSAAVAVAVAAAQEVLAQVPVDNPVLRCAWPCAT
jgi:hypothetical protein